MSGDDVQSIRYLADISKFQKQEDVKGNWTTRYRMMGCVSVVKCFTLLTLPPSLKQRQRLASYFSSGRVNKRAYILCNNR